RACLRRVSKRVFDGIQQPISLLLKISEQAFLLIWPSRVCRVLRDRQDSHDSTEEPVGSRHILKVEVSVVVRRCLGYQQTTNAIWLVLRSSLASAGPGVR